MWTMASTVVSHPIGKVGALYASAATLPQAASPLQAGNKPLNVAKPMQVERGSPENPGPP